MFFLLFSITTETLFLKPMDSSEVYLGYSNILLGSDSVYLGDSLLPRDSTYVLDYNKGLIRFKKTIKETLWVRFTHLDFPVGEVYRRYSPFKTDSIHKKTPIRDSTPDKGDLLINGNKGIFMEVTGGGTNVTQSLWMQIGGEAGNFKISGVLSDENIPEGKGASQNIQEIDEIYIEAQSPYLSFRVGDIEATHEGVKKRLLGLAGNYKRLSGVAGISRGKYGKFTFRGEEGNQGPYKLNPGNGNIDFSIIRGSEQVYLDGKLLKAGIDNDYVMNYYEGTITFSPSVFIDNESTILILFEYHPYGVNNLFYNANFNEGGFNLSFSRQEDLSEREKFSRVYPDSGFGYVYSSTYVGKGNGDYDLSDSIFVYQGKNKGSYQVYFEWAGTGKGEYEYIDSLHLFKWTGDGPWTAKRKIDLPGEDNLISLDIDRNLTDLSIRGKFKGRRYSNQFTDDNDDGFAGDIHATYSPNQFINLSANYYRRSSDFITREWEGERDLLKIWGINELPDNFAEYSIKTNPIHQLKASYLWGRAGSTRRDRILGELSPLYIEWDRIEKFREEIKGGIRWDKFNLYLRNLSRDNNYRNEAVFESKPLYLGAGLEGDESGDTAKIYTIKTDLTYANTTVKASHRRRENLNSGEINSISNGTLLSDLKLLFFNIGGKLNLSQKRTTKWERYYLEVDLGEGNYSYDSTNGTYYENPYGDYVLEIVPTGEGIDIREYSGNISLESDRYIYLQGFISATYRVDLFLENNASFIFKFPRKGKRRFSIKYDRSYIDDKEGWIVRRQKEDNSIRLGLEEKTGIYREYGLQWDQSLYEWGFGPYIYFWMKNGLGMEATILRIAGEDTLFSSKLKSILYLAGNRSSGTMDMSIGYNYFPGVEVTSERMGTLYPPGIFYDFGAAVTLDITESFHLVLNGNLHKLSGEKLYYRGRFGVSADFGP